VCCADEVGDLLSAAREARDEQDMNVLEHESGEGLSASLRQSLACRRDAENP